MLWRVWFYKEKIPKSIFIEAVDEITLIKKAITKLKDFQLVCWKLETDLNEKEEKV